MRKINISNDSKRDAEVAFGTTFHRPSSVFKTAEARHALQQRREADPRAPRRRDCRQCEEGVGGNVTKLVFKYGKQNHKENKSYLR